MGAQLKRSIINLLIWSVVAVLFLIVFFGENTISDWGDNTAKTIMLAILLGIGFLGQLVLSIVFRKSKKEIPDDEIENRILLKAMSSAFIVTMIYIYVVAIALYTYFEKSGLVPVAWLWFIAYSLILVVNIVTSSFYIFHHKKSDD